jgi:signal transduction histidine kinase
MIGSILEETERLTAMVDSLLLLSRADEGKADLRPAPMSLPALANEVAADLAVLAEEKRQHVRVEVSASVTVVADRPAVRQAAINLLDNAIKYSPDGAVIRLVVRQDGPGAVLEVIDNGPGIAPEHLPHVFERFYRADKARSRAAGSAGLGLAIARWAIETNGGRIEAESEVSRGSVFRIVLPAAR